MMLSPHFAKYSLPSLSSLLFLFLLILQANHHANAASNKVEYSVEDISRMEDGPLRRHTIAETLQHAVRGNEIGKVDDLLTRFGE
jgi:hypothetical protein